MWPYAFYSFAYSSKKKKKKKKKKKTKHKEKKTLLLSPHLQANFPYAQESRGLMRQESGRSMAVHLRLYCLPPLEAPVM